MAGVAATVLAGPASSVYVLGPAATLLLPSVGAMLGVTLGLGVHPGFYTKPDKITSEICGLCPGPVMGPHLQAGTRPLLCALTAAPHTCRRRNLFLRCLLLPPAVLHDLLEEGRGLLCLYTMAQVCRGARRLLFSRQVSASLQSGALQRCCTAFAARQKG